MKSRREAKQGGAIGRRFTAWRRSRRCRPARRAAAGQPQPL